MILDEAQAIKNADSQAAKAARLLKGRHRLAMSGTPIENHLGELWSIFEFLNPGMLGTASVFKKHASGASAADEGARAAPGPGAPAVHPPADQGAGRQGPPREVRADPRSATSSPRSGRSTRSCKAHYRQALLRKDAAELGRSKIEVLEALLRLRQAACHPGLIDPERAGDPSAKLDMLIPQLVEVAEEGHKILVFSQFTKFLGLVRDRLDAEGMKYEYLDGRTRNRAERVERFQTDPDIPALPDQPEGRRPGPEPDRRRLRLPARPLVEPRRRGPGDRPLAPDRPDPAGLRLPPDLPRHRRAEDPRAPAEEARPRRRHPQREPERHRHPDQGRPGVPAVVREDDHAMRREDPRMNTIYLPDGSPRDREA